MSTRGLPARATESVSPIRLATNWLAGILKMRSLEPIITFGRARVAGLQGPWSGEPAKAALEDFGTLGVCAFSVGDDQPLRLPREHRP